MSNIITGVEVEEEMMTTKSYQRLTYSTEFRIKSRQNKVDLSTHSPQDCVGAHKEVPSLQKSPTDRTRVTGTELIITGITGIFTVQ